MSRDSAVAAVAGVAAALVLLLLPSSGTTFAWFTDSADMDSGAFTGGTVSVPTLSCGAVGVLSVTFDWTSVAGATDYTLHYGPGGASTVTVAGTTYTDTVAVSSGTAWVVANRDFGATTWSSVDSNQVSYVVAAVSLCS